jgi:hypothetical protein
MTASDICFLLENLRSSADSKATVEIDRTVRDFLVSRIKPPRR